MPDISYIYAFLSVILVIIVISAVFIKRQNVLLKISNSKFDQLKEKIDSIEKDGLRIENAMRGRIFIIENGICQ